jgi:hypothetical protein
MVVLKTASALLLTFCGLPSSAASGASASLASATDCGRATHEGGW